MLLDRNLHPSALIHTEDATVMSVETSTHDVAKSHKQTFCIHEVHET
jgi:hypothetical protein